MKTLTACVALLPLLLGASLPVGTEDPDYGCDLKRGFCVVNLDVMKELMQGLKKRCTERDT